jgi:hypothetical protein
LLLRPLLVLVGFGLAACDGGGGTSPITPSPTAPGSTESSAPGTPSPTASVSSLSPTASPTPRPIPPAWAAPVEADVAPEDLLDAQLVPPEATLTARVALPAGEAVADEVAVAYVIGSDPFAAEHGFAVWQRFPEPPAWSVVFAFVDAPEEGVLGIDVQGSDLTGDGHADAMTFEQTGGSGACGRWRVVATIAGDTAQVFSRRTCDTEIAIVDGALEMREAVFGPDDPHCCPRAFRYTTLEWDGSRFVETDVREEPVGTT